jgi:hypothetical protein
LLPLGDIRWLALKPNSTGRKFNWSQTMKVTAASVIAGLCLAHIGARQPADLDSAACINGRASLRDERG